MNTKLVCILAVALFATTAVWAQDGRVMTAIVPFSFQAGSVNLPAGEYTIRTNIGPGVVWLRSADAKSVAVILTNACFSMKYNETGKLVFNRYGDSHFLSQVWSPGQSGRALATSAREKELAQNLGAAGKKVLVATAGKIR